nr:MAG TPA: hypothetical protein [Caudoviricetes sp.]
MGKPCTCIRVYAYVRVKQCFIAENRLILSPYNPPFLDREKSILNKLSFVSLFFGL